MRVISEGTMVYTWQLEIDMRTHFEAARDAARNAEIGSWLALIACSASAAACALRELWLPAALFAVSTLLAFDSALRWRALRRRWNELMGGA